MYNVITLADNEAVSNPDWGYMKRHEIENASFVFIIGDKVEQWSTNTLEQGVSISQPS